MNKVTKSLDEDKNIIEETPANLYKFGRSFVFL